MLMAAYTQTEQQKNTLTAAGVLAGLPQPLNLLVFCFTYILLCLTSFRHIK